MTEAEQIVDHLMAGLGDSFPADPALDDTWCLSHKEFRNALLMAIEQAQETMFDPTAARRVVGQLKRDLDEARRAVLTLMRASSIELGESPYLMLRRHAAQWPWLIDRVDEAHP
jgi:hypothetical protein